MSTTLPRLPPEILDIILEFALLSKTTKPLSFEPFHRVREQDEERELHRLSLSGSFAVKKVLFHDPHLATRTRADKLSSSLRLALPGHPETKGYLARLVERLSIEVREREVTTQEDPRENYAGATGLMPLQIAELAILLPNLEALDVLAGDRGGWAGSEMVNALARFKKVRHLELQGLGWANGLAVCAKMDKLEVLKAKSCVPGLLVINEFAKAQMPTPISPPPFVASLTSLTLWDCALATGECTSLFETLAPASHLPVTAHPLGGPDALPLPSLRSLTIHNLKQLEGNVYPIPFDANLLVSHLLPLIPHLTSLHLVLFERRIIANNGDRSVLVSSGALVNGHVSTLPDSGARPGNTLAAALGKDAKHLTLGGAFCISSSLIDALDTAASTTGARLTRLTLQQCTNIGRWADGIQPEELVKALDREWASALEILDVRRMQDTQPTSDEPAFGEEALASLVAKAEEISASRVREGSLVGRLTAVVDEEVGRRAREEREYYEKQKARAKGKNSSRGRSKSVTTAEDRGNGVSGEKNKAKRSKTKG